MDRGFPWSRNFSVASQVRRGSAEGARFRVLSNAWPETPYERNGSAEFTPQYLSKRPGHEGHSRATPPHRQNHLDVALWEFGLAVQTRDYTDAAVICQARKRPFASNPFINNFPAAQSYFSAVAGPQTTAPVTRIFGVKRGFCRIFRLFRARGLTLRRDFRVSLDGAFMVRIA